MDDRNSQYDSKIQAWINDAKNPSSILYPPPHRSSRFLIFQPIIVPIQPPRRPLWFILPPNTLDILMKSMANIQYPLKMALLDHHHVPFIKVNVRILFRLRLRERNRRLQRIADIPAIQLRLPGGRALKDPLLRAGGDPDFSCLLLGELGEEALPHLLAVVAAQWFVADGDVDAGDEGVVDLADAVGGEEEETFKVFHAAEEG